MPESTSADTSFDGDAPAGNTSLMPSATGIRRAVMDWLARREHARCEIEKKLQRRFPDATAAIGPVLDQLEHEGLLSTSRFIDNFTRSRVRRGYGPRRIAAELREKGIRGADGSADGGTNHVTQAEAGDCISSRTTQFAAANDNFNTINWLAQAREVRCRRFGEALPSGPAERNRQMAFLQRRGFAASVCRQACQPPRDED